ncbi:MAG: hypothetical protein GY845_37170, partial [Planctomycetes bacterium]|nr:hypothetical protein [Planctomycetota bacterium]
MRCSVKIPIKKGRLSELLNSIRSSDSNVRKSAISALGNLGIPDKKIIHALLKALKTNSLLENALKY